MLMNPRCPACGQHLCGEGALSNASISGEAETKRLLLHSLVRPPTTLCTAYAPADALASPDLAPHDSPAHRVFTGDRAALSGLLARERKLWVQDAGSSHAVLGLSRRLGDKAPGLRDRVEMEGAVRVTGTLSDVAGAARISTERLAFDTRTEIVSTQVPVTLTWSGHRLQARGMRANLKDQRLQLESAVHGHFVP